MSYIISSSANAVHTEDGQGSLGLHLAAEGGHTSVVERLMKVHVSEVTLCTRLVAFLRIYHSVLIDIYA